MSTTPSHKIDREEWRNLVLDMCQAVDDCCRKHDIKYSLSCGTLIGAYRHRGFIPWDDDFDIMMTRENYEKFNKVFKHERYKSVNCFNNPLHFYTFGRIIDTKTFYLGKRNIFGGYNKKLGVNLDLYIADNVPVKEEERNKIYNKILKYKTYRKYFGYLKKLLNLFGLFQSSFFPLTYIARKRSILYLRCKNNGKKILPAGPITQKIIWDESIFNEYIDCRFEDRTFMSIRDYDKFLTKVFGNWMSPPPKDKRVPYHGNNYFIRE